MSSLLPFLVLERACDEVLGWVTQELQSAGFRVAQTFDLHVACLAHPECLYPQHGDVQCSCEMVVLLIYRKQEEPSTLIIHGQGNMSWISLAVPVDRHNNQQLEISIRRVLTLPLPNVPSTVEATDAVRPTV